MKNNSKNDIVLGSPLTENAKKIEILYENILGETRMLVSQNGKLINVIDGNNADKILNSLISIDISLNEEIQP